MKQLFTWEQEIQQLIITAMAAHRKNLNGSGQMLFDIAFDKIKKMKPSIALDGMEMIFVSESLHSYSKHLACQSLYEESAAFRELGNDMEIIRVKFQQSNLPKILKEKEKAASAGTLTA